VNISCDDRSRWRRLLSPGVFAKMDAMTIRIEIAPDTEAKLSAQAAARGVTLPDYLRQILEQQANPASGAQLSPAAKAALWRESTKDLPDTRPLPDNAIGRESIYDTRL